MHPTPSIILFTLSSGAGIGLLLLLVLLHGLNLAAPVPLDTRLFAGGLALALIVGGLVASVFHLANPKNAWKAFNRFRTSWLSREGVFSVALMAITVVYLLGISDTGDSQAIGLRIGALLVFALGLATLFSTGMIYASLKPIRQWRNPLVPPIYLLMGLATGGVILTVVERVSGGPTRTTVSATVLALAGAALAKAVYYVWIGRPAGPTINTATGMTQAQVKLLDAGHSHRTFLTAEFGNTLRRAGSGTWRTVVFVFAFLLPAIGVIALARGAAPAFGVLAILSAFAGAAVERWLFFVEARHVVNLYHGSPRT